MLGNPTDIAKGLAENKEAFKTEYTDNVNSKVGFNLVVKTVNDDIYIKRSNDGKFHTYLNNTDMSAYNLKNNDTEGIMMSYKTGSWFSLNRKHNGSLEIEIPENVLFDKIIITSQAGHIEIEMPIQGKNVSIEGTSSNANVNDIKSNDIYIHTVTGNMNFGRLSASKTKILSVSGNVNVDEIEGSEINAETISGDVLIKQSNARSKTSSVTGKISIGEVNTKNFKTKAKEFFKR